MANEECIYLPTYQNYGIKLVLVDQNQGYVG
jgi:hypothetical protein